MTKTRLSAGAALLGFVLILALALSAAAATSALTVTTPEPTYLQALEVKSASLLFAVGAATIVRSTDGGNSWRTYSVPGVGAIAGASFFDRSRWWLASGGSGRPGVRVSILFTHNAAARWRRALLPRRYPDGHGLVHFAFADARQGWLTVDTVHGSAFADVDLYRTTNGGAGWTYLGSRPFSGPIGFVAGRLWATTGPTSDGLATSSDRGRSWHAVSIPVPAKLEGQARTVALPRALRLGGGLVLATSYRRSVGGRDVVTVVIDVSSDRGRGWRATARLTDSGFSQFGSGVEIPTAFAGGRAWVVAGGLRLHLTDDGGRYWRSIIPDVRATGLPGLVGLSEIVFPAANTGFGLIEYGHCRQFKRGCTQRSYVVRSTDRGRQWAIVSLDPAAAAAPLCQPRQLAATAGFGGATGSALGGITIRNSSGSACSLSQRPRVALFGQGQRLAVRESRPLALYFPQLPVRLLRPGGRTVVSLQWFNWCGGRTAGPANVVVELRLAPGETAVRAQASDVPIPRCDAPRAHSMLWVGGFVEPAP